MKMLAISAFGLALLSSAAMAETVAGPDGAPAAVKVKYSDLDLGKTADARLMIARLDQAVADVCGSGSFAARDQKQPSRGACHRENMEQALATLGSPVVNALYYGRDRAVAAH